MMKSFVLLQWLLYMNPAIGFEYTAVTQNCFIFDSTTAVKTGNRVCNNAVPLDEEIEQIKSSFGATQFTWAVNVMDTESIQALEKHGLHYRVTLPAMKMNLDALQAIGDDCAIHAIEISSNTNDLMLWASIVSPAFTVPEVELVKLVRVLNQRITSPHLKLYLGYYNQIAAAACMAIQHGETISLHWIATNSEFRSKGLGRAVAHKALESAQESGCKQAILLSSAAGKHMYERLGFEEYDAYVIYGNY